MPTGMRHGHAPTLWVGVGSWGMSGDQTVQGGTYPQSPATPEIINLALGQPSPQMLPLAMVASAAERALGAGADPLILQYGAIAGPADFRESLAALVARRYGHPVEANQLMVTGGTSSAISMVSQVFARSGQSVVCSDPTYFLARGMFETQGLQTVGVEIDALGMRVDKLEYALRRERLRPAFVYCIPSFHNPGGVVLCPQRAQRLIELAEQYDFVIVADEPYVMLHFDPQPPPCMMSFDEGRGRVLSLGTFSKILGPGMRLGWAHAEPRVLARLSEHGALRSGGGLNPLGSAVTHSIVESGDLDANIDALRERLRTGKDALVSAVRQWLPSARFVDPGGGYFVWLEFPEGVDTSALAARAGDYGLAFTAGQRCAVGRDLSRCMRLSFSFYRPQELAEGVQRLARLLR